MREIFNRSVKGPKFDILADKYNNFFFCGGTILCLVLFERLKKELGALSLKKGRI